VAEPRAEEKVKGRLEVDRLYKGKSGLWGGHREAYPLPLVNSTGLNYHGPAVYDTTTNE
jgi:hypothetical protein